MKKKIQTTTTHEVIKLCRVDTIILLFIATVKVMLVAGKMKRKQYNERCCNQK